MADDGLEGSTTFESPVVGRTRLVPPRLRAETVDRPALVARRLTSPARLGVVTGPAGSGKSVLLAQCHVVDPFPAWLSLERADNDIVALWWSMIEALRTVVGDFGETYRTRLLAAGSGAVDDLGRLRANGDLVEIGASDLALSTQEARQLLASFDLSLDQAHLDLLVARTEGWPAGLNLAGLAIARVDDVGARAHHTAAAGWR